MSLKSQTRERMQPKMGKIDINYQKAPRCILQISDKAGRLAHPKHICPRPSATQTLTVLFLSSLFFTSLLGARLTLESLAFRAQLLKAGLDGCELGSGFLQPATRPSAFSRCARHLSARTCVSSKHREASASSASFSMHHPPPPVPIPLPHPTTSFTDASHPAASSCVSHTTHRVWGTHMPSEHPLSPTGRGLSSTWSSASG
jgi:hypothetical protein